MSNNSQTFSSVERIDTRLIWSFGILILMSILILSLFAGFYYQKILQKDEQRLALLSSQILNTAINRTSFSGKYQTRLLIEEISRTFQDIKYIEIVDTRGVIIGHSNSSYNGQRVDLKKALPILNEQKTSLIQTVNDNGEESIEILQPYRSGYRNKINGFVRMMISRKVVNQDIYEGLFYLTGLVIMLLLLSLFIVRKLSHYFSRPVFFMADVLKGILEHSPVLIAIQDKNGKLFQNSHSYQRYFPDQNRNSFSPVLNPDDYKNEGFWKDNEVKEKLFEVTIKDHLKTLRALHFPIAVDAQGCPNLICCIAEDVSERIRIEKKLQSNEEQLQLVLKGASLGFWDWNFQTGAQDVDQIWREQLGVNESDLQYTIVDWQNRMHPEDKARTMNIVQEAINKKQSYTTEYRMLNQSGQWIWIQSSGTVVEWSENGQPLRLCGTHQDISLRKQNEEDLLFLANYDNLTKLPNRNLLKEEMKFCLAQKRRDNGQLGVFFIDLDNFKIVNDTYGHDFGDLLLINVVAKLKQIIGDEEIFSRFGGDEFVLVVNSFDDLDSLSILAQNIIQILREPIVLKQHSIYAGVSIGISVFPYDGADFNLLLRNADTAMYKAKDAGRNQYCFYTARMNEEIQAHLDIASRLQKALENNDKNKELFMVYQPQVDVCKGKIKACEALLRWHDPEKGFIPPASFIPVTEKSNLIVKLGDWVFEQVCQQRKQWRDMGMDNIRVDVNLSSRQFSDPAVVDKIRSMMEKYQLKKGDIGLEITESAIIDGDEHTSSAIYQLREMGFEIAIDDFGTGYSSLSYIKRFPISSIKIDRAFITDAPHKSDDSAIVRTIIAMAKTLGLNVIAEGVETEAQYNFIQQSSCQYTQGFYLHKPMSADMFMRLISKKTMTLTDYSS